MCPPSEPDADLSEIRRVASVMGTVVSIAVWAAPAHRARVEAAAVRALAWLHEVDDRFTTWRPGSEWLRYAQGALALSDAHPDLALVVDRCAALTVETGGAFSISAGEGPPDPAAYVKGWATQRAAELMIEAGVVKGCVNCGGDVVVWGGDRLWRVGIQSPFHRDEVRAVVEVGAGAVATSGTYERGLHLVDPQTNEPAAGFASVTVVGPDLGLADAYSTALFVAGPAGLRWLPTNRGYGAYLIHPDDTTTSVGMIRVDEGEDRWGEAGKGEDGKGEDGDENEG